MATFSGSLPPDSTAGLFPSNYFANTSPVTASIAFSSVAPRTSRTFPSSLIGLPNVCANQLSITISAIDNHTVRVTF